MSENDVKVTVGGHVSGQIVAGSGNVAHYHRADATPESAEMPDRHGVGRVLVVSDVQGSGVLNSQQQARMRRELLRILRDGASALGLSWDDTESSDRGDGWRLVMSPETEPPARVLDEFVPTIARGLHEHAAASSPAASIKLRLAVHFGFLDRIAGEWSGDPLVHATRLVDARAVKNVFGDNPDAYLALVVSDEIYQKIVRHGHTRLGPNEYQRVAVSENETSTVAWLRLV